MAVILFLIFAYFTSASVVFCKDLSLVLEFPSSANISGRDPPVFPSQYVTKGILYIPYSEIIEPFNGWYDAHNGNSRIDYYGGMVKSFQLTKKGNYGQMLKIAPVTTESETNIDTCLQLNGTASFKIPLQNLVPDLRNYVYQGSDICKGMLADKWQYIHQVGDRVNKYTLCLQYKKSKKNGDLIPIPIQFVMKGVNVLFGSHFDHYWIDYEFFSDETPDPSVFVPGMTCHPFPGPGDAHYVTFNPMSEFVPHDTSSDIIDTAFDNFIKSYDKIYVADHEHVLRKESFRHNLRYINSMNRAGLRYTLAVNFLADKTSAELKVLRGRQYTAGYNGGNEFPYNVSREIGSLPSDLDWRLYGAVTPVKDQSVCGSCWSFGTTGTIEGAYFVRYNRLIRLSQQALIDCSWGFGNNGCDGGEDFRSYQWMMKHGGLPTEDSYGPYEGQDGYCHVDNVTLTARISGYVNVTSGDAEALKIALFKHGPITVAIDASHESFAFYSNGIYYEPKCGNKLDQLDHQVLLVGYGTLNGESYWLIKNSWSNLWGNDGYVLMSPRDNNCGVMTSPTYVTF